MYLNWNPWHGCRMISPGCQNCYVYRRDRSVGRDAGTVLKTADFDLPVRRGRGGQYKLPPGAEVFSCGTSDFFLEAADPWRAQAWSFIAARPDLRFLIITKRIDRFYAALPEDWGAGYPNVTIGCTCENQDRADYRLPLFLKAPIAHRIIIAEPLLEGVDFSPYLDARFIEKVVAGGESGEAARLCRCAWIAAIRGQCIEANVPFTFKQTGARFEKDGRVYRIPRHLQMAQARASGLSTEGGWS
jgi:protein gp37